MSIHGLVSKENVMSILMAVLLSISKQGGSVNVVMWKILEYMMLSEINPAQKDSTWSLSGESHNLCGQREKNEGYQRLSGSRREWGVADQKHKDSDRAEG